VRIWTGAAPRTSRTDEAICSEIGRLARRHRDDLDDLRIASPPTNALDSPRMLTSAVSLSRYFAIAGGSDYRPTAGPITAVPGPLTDQNREVVDVEADAAGEGQRCEGLYVRPGVARRGPACLRRVC